ncbi:hypothetical protein EZ242_10570 [Ramlibacter rhizophilus]|uniref:Uncharacterized protein n=1 Tax=Ramlibacter rhizophilus TaxID=1781167 RepID=A0A4Z0BMH2_9BURK|nr:hypothetical protein EZ242_10570 [Ramlibacter rhizophilus]
MSWRPTRLCTWLLAGCLSLPWALPAWADAASMQARHAQLSDVLAASPFGQPLHIESREVDDRLQGAVYAVLDHPFERVRDALRQPSNWCDIMILPFNTKYCHAVRSANGPGLLIRIGRKYDQPLEDSYKLLFDWNPVAASEAYFESRLSAPEGPVDTRDYRINVSAIPLEGGRTFLRLGYSYGFGFTGRLAMNAYLATAGADKVGFSRVGEPGGPQRLIGGMRGTVERNAMRYYLAIDAFLDSLQAPPAQRAERRVQAWFNATERYPQQLREMNRETYVGMKRMEIARQRELIQ